MALAPTARTAFRTSSGITLQRRHQNANFQGSSVFTNKESNSSRLRRSTSPSRHVTNSRRSLRFLARVRCQRGLRRTIALRRRNLRLRAALAQHEPEEPGAMTKKRVDQASHGSGIRNASHGQGSGRQRLDNAPGPNGEENPKGKRREDSKTEISDEPKRLKTKL